MGLFDDLLGNNSNSQATQATQTTPVTPVTVTNDAQSILVNETPAEISDPMITFEEKTSTPPQVDVFLNMSAGNITADMPSYTDRKASGETVLTSSVSNDASSILINETPTVTATETTSLFGGLDAVSQTTTESVPVVETTETPVFSLEEAPTAAVVSDSSEAPMLFEMTDAVATDNSKDEAIWEVTKQDEEPSSATSETKMEESNEADLFGFSQETENVEVEKAISFEEEASEVATTSPNSTLDFIALGLAQLDSMEKNLTDQKNHFLEEAENFRLEKEKFAQKEQEALKNSRSMDDEQIRIDTMRKFFETQQKKQKDGSEITESVSTALAGMSVQNAVDNAIKPKTRSKKSALV